MANKSFKYAQKAGRTPVGRRLIQTLYYLEMNERKPFLPSPRYKPLRNAVFAFLVGVTSFGLIMLGAQLNGAFSILSIIGTVIFIAAFLFALFFWFQYIWIMFIKGGWKEENKEYIETIKSKQPWER